MGILAGYASLVLVKGSRLTMEFTGASYVASPRTAAFGRRIRSNSKVDDIPGLIQLLQQILVFDPLRRPSVPDLLKYPWFVGASDVAIPPEPTPESDFSSSDDSV